MIFKKNVLKHETNFTLYDKKCFSFSNVVLNAESFKYLNSVLKDKQELKIHCCHIVHIDQLYHQQNDSQK